MRITSHIRRNLVLADLEGGSVDQVIGALATHLAGKLEGVEKHEVERRLLEREEAHTTAMGQGVALPHATIEGLAEPVLMVARAREPIPFGPEESPPVSIFFVLLSPPGREREHIKLLARICRLVRHPEFLEDLRQAPDEDGMVQAIESMDEQHV